jgi:phage FluMu protein Com
MAAPSESLTHYEVTCPHCGKTFIGKLLAGSAARYRGFKCPHCQLFMPYERVEETAGPDTAA